MTQRDPRFVDGYVADSLYPSMFHHRFSPAWTDLFLARGRIPAPRKARGPFTLVDAGCGDGFGLIVNAVAHPEGQFFGFDASAAHIARGKQLVRALKLKNIELKRTTLARARAPFEADYITAQGLLAWISRANQEALWAFASRTLKAGGAFTVGYNALPGWTHVIPFQRLARAFADYAPGNSADRFVAGFVLTSSTGLVSEDALANIELDMSGRWSGYVAHEYLNQFWDPLWSGDVIQAAEEHGLQFARTAMEGRVREDFAFTKEHRAMLASISHDRPRETAADICRNTGFRTDIFVKPSLEVASEDAKRRAQLDQFWILPRRPADVVYSHATPAGTLRFDNRAARAIVDALQTGPANLRAISSVAENDLLNTVDALFAAGVVRPMNAPTDVPAAAELNRRILDGRVQMNGLVGNCGAVAPAQEHDELTAEDCQRLGVPR